MNENTEVLRLDVLLVELSVFGLFSSGPFSIPASFNTVVTQEGNKETAHGTVKPAKQVPATITFLELVIRSFVCSMDQLDEKQGVDIVTIRGAIFLFYLRVKITVFPIPVFMLS